MHPNSLANLKSIQKGEVRNPNGCSNAVRKRAELKGKLQGNEDVPGDYLIDLVQNKKASHNVKLQAAKYLYDQIHGKATQQIEVTTTDGDGNNSTKDMRLDLSQLTVAERKTYLELQRKCLIVSDN